jgi:hypothetical protein
MGKASDGWPSTLIDASAAHVLVCCVTSNCGDEADSSFSYLKFKKLLLEYCNLIFPRYCYKPTAMLQQFEMCSCTNRKTGHPSTTEHC